MNAMSSIPNPQLFKIFIDIYNKMTPILVPPFLVCYYYIIINPHPTHFQLAVEKSKKHCLPHLLSSTLFWIGTNCLAKFLTNEILIWNLSKLCFAIWNFILYFQIWIPPTTFNVCNARSSFCKCSCHHKKNIIYLYKGKCYDIP